MIIPQVSVIMLTYNREKYIAEAIQSVLAQTFDDLELIIIDDGSTDSTADIVMQLKNEKIRYFQYGHCGKGSRLRNAGIEKSKGKFIAFIDSDDVWCPEKLQHQVKILYREDSPAFTFTDVVEFSGTNTILKNGMYKNWLPDDGNFFNEYVNNEFSIYPSTVMFDKRCLQVVGQFNEDFPWTDNEFFHRLVYHFKSFLVKKTLVRIRKHDSNTSTKAGEGTVAEMQHMLKRFHQAGMINTKTFRKMTAYYYYMGGLQYLTKKRLSSARTSFAHCVAQNPFHLKAMIRFTLSYFY